MWCFFHSLPEQWGEQTQWTIENEGEADRPADDEDKTRSLYVQGPASLSRNAVIGITTKFILYLDSGGHIGI